MLQHLDREVSLCAKLNWLMDRLTFILTYFLARTQLFPLMPVYSLVVTAKTGIKQRL